MADKEKVLSLTQFLLDNPVNNEREEVYVSQRFKDAGYTFTISPMSGEQFSAYQKEATAVGRHKKVNFDSKLFNERVVINHTLNPNFKDAETVKQSGCVSPEAFMYKVLKAGEIIELSNKISVLSGFDSDLDDQVEEVKNS